MNKLLAFLAVLLMGVAGCHNGGTSQNSTTMRALNAVADAEPLDVLVDGDVKFGAVAVNSATSFTNFDSGTREVVVRSSTNQAVLFDKSLTFSGDSRGTLLIYGKRAAVNVTFMVDDATAPSSGKARVRVAGLAPDAGPVDVYLTPTDISATPALVNSAAAGAITAASEVTAGNYKIVVTAAGTQDILFQTSTAQSFSQGANLTFAILPAVGGKLVNGMLVDQGSGTNGTATYLPNPFARLKAINANPTSSGLNFKADGATLLSNVPYTGASSYVSVSAGARNLQVEASNVPGTIIASLQRTLDPARDYSLLAMGSASGATSLAILTDDNTLPTGGNVKIRFANALTDGAKVDVLLNFAGQAAGIAPATATTYYTVAAGLNFTITFATPGGVNVVSTLSGVELDAPGIYTVYVFGTTASAQAKLVRDR